MSQNNTKYSKETHMRKRWPPSLWWELFPYSWTTSHDSLGQRHWLAHRDFSAKELVHAQGTGQTWNEVTRQVTPAPSMKPVREVLAAVYRPGRDRRATESLESSSVPVT